jgi:hypothetical protein
VAAAYEHDAHYSEHVMHWLLTHIGSGGRSGAITELGEGQVTLGPGRVRSLASSSANFGRRTRNNFHFRSAWLGFPGRFNLRWYSFRLLSPTGSATTYQKNTSSAVSGHTTLIPIQDRQRMHEFFASPTTRHNYFNSHPCSRELQRNKMMVSYAREVVKAMDAELWPVLQRHCAFDLRLGDIAKGLQKQMATCAS